jgi:uncharacterized protein YvpB
VVSVEAAPLSDATGKVAVATAATATTAAVPTPAATPAVTTRVNSVPFFAQTYNLSCEEAALEMALAAEGIHATESQILAMIGIDWTPATYDASGLRWGDPYTSFVGNPNGSEVTQTGYGTYYPTIARVAAALGGNVIAAGEGITPSAVYDAVLAGHPVVAWVTYQWVTAQRTDYVAYDGRVIPYAGPVEHAVTVVGVSDTTVTINNPDSGVEVVSKATFEAAYATYNQMAVVLG